MTNAAQIIEQRDAGLISAGEARATLQHLVKQATWNACYSDSPDSYKRWIAEGVRAQSALNGGPRLTVIIGGLAP